MHAIALSATGRALGDVIIINGANAIDIVGKISHGIGFRKICEELPESCPDYIISAINALLEHDRLKVDDVVTIVLDIFSEAYNMRNRLLLRAASRR